MFNNLTNRVLKNVVYLLIYNENERERERGERKKNVHAFTSDAVVYS